MSQLLKKSLEKPKTRGKPIKVAAKKGKNVETLEVILEDQPPKVARAILAGRVKAGKTIDEI